MSNIPQRIFFKPTTTPNKKSEIMRYLIIEHGNFGTTRTEFTNGDHASTYYVELCQSKPINWFKKLFTRKREITFYDNGVAVAYWSGY